MSPITHFLAGWALAETAAFEKRDRALVTLAGVIPDADGIGLIAEWLTRGSAHPLHWWSDYHHVLGHNLSFAVAVTLCFGAFARRKKLCACWVFLSFHLHLFCDLIGSRGPDGDPWPIPYLAPFSRTSEWVWSGQWPLNSWQNMLITAGLMAWTLGMARKKGYSPVEMFSGRADRGLIAALRKRFPNT